MKLSWENCNIYSLHFLYYYYGFFFHFEPIGFAQTEKKLSTFLGFFNPKTIFTEHKPLISKTEHVTTYFLVVEVIYCWGFSQCGFSLWGFSLWRIIKVRSFLSKVFGIFIWCYSKWIAPKRRWKTLKNH